MKRFVILAAAVVLIAAGWFAFGPKEQTGRLQPNSASIVAEGRALYAEHCASCHGANLEGQPDWQIPLADGRLPAPPHDASGHTWHHDDETLIALTRDGTAVYLNDPDHATDMHGFKDLLSEQQIVAVLSFIKSTWPASIQSQHDQINARRQN